MPAFSTFPAHTHELILYPLLSLMVVEHDSAHAKAEWAHSLYPAEHSFSFQPCHLCTLGQAVSLVLYVESDLAGIFHSYWSLSWYLKSEKCFNFLIINLAEYLMQWYRFALKFLFKILHHYLRQYFGQGGVGERETFPKVLSACVVQDGFYYVKVLNCKR